MSFFLTLMSLLPALFYMWGGSVFVLGGYYLIRSFNANYEGSIKTASKAICASIALFEILIGLFLLVPAIPFSLIEIAVSITFWYTILLIYGFHFTKIFVPLKK